MNAYERIRSWCGVPSALLTTLAIASVSPARAQQPESRLPAADSSFRSSDRFTIAAGSRYRGGPLKRWVLGNTYRDLWTTPIEVPVLNLGTFAGGVRPRKAGGGMQTKSLHLVSESGTDYVFRLTDKTVIPYIPAMRHTPLDGIFQDQVSALHPAAAQLSAAIVEASGVLHPTPVIVFMPDDPALGEFRAAFGNRLGMLEEYPTVPDKGTGFMGADKIIDSEELLERLNRDGQEHIDARAFLTARLVDYLINDTDRHQGNWKWARRNSASDAPWEPIARDRDHAFASYDGWLMSAVRKVQPRIVSLDDAPTDQGITQSRALDARMLESLERPAYDSIARSLKARITDSVIAAAMAAMPGEYQASAARLTAALKRRRAALPEVAQQFYHLLSSRVEVHGTDADDWASVSRLDDSTVTVRLATGGRMMFARRFDVRDTKEILVYLMNGNDTAVVSGSVARSIPVRIVGGNGANVLVDSSNVAGVAEARLYQNGVVQGVRYGADTLFDRRAWEWLNDSLVPPQRDFGSKITPLVGMGFHRRIGFTPLLGVARYGYAYAHRPYNYMVKAEGEYATSYQGMRVGVTADKRLENSPWHLMAFGRVSDFEMVHYSGLGNNTTDSGSTSHYFDVPQRQWLLQPSIGYAVGDRLGFTFGPVLKRAVTATVPNSFLAATRPYGFGTFNQAGVQVGAEYEWRQVRNDVEHTHHRIMASFSGTYYPAVLDVQKPFTTLKAVMGTSISVPVPLDPFFVVRAGATKLYGPFPFFEAATIGGQGNTRYMDTQRFAGDAALYASSELRIPVVRFRFIMPVRAGVLGIAEAGRVYSNGQSPGGWYTRTGQGFWIGRGRASPVVTFTWTTEPGNPGAHVRLGLNF